MTKLNMECTLLDFISPSNPVKFQMTFTICIVFKDVIKEKIDILKVD